MNGLALTSAWEVAARYGEHCEASPDDCASVVSLARRTLLSGLAVNGLLVGGAGARVLGEGVQAHGRALLPAALLPAAALTSRQFSLS
jgi:hypothetical protein